MKTTRFIVEYNINALPLSMKVDAACAKDAVEAVLAAYPNASITAVLEKCPVCEKKEEACPAQP